MIIKDISIPRYIMKTMEIIRLDIFLACNNISSSYNRRDRDRKYHWREWERQRYSRAKKKKNSVGQEGTSTAADRSVIASTFIGKLADSCLRPRVRRYFIPYFIRSEKKTVRFRLILREGRFSKNLVLPQVSNEIGRKHWTKFQSRHESTSVAGLVALAAGERTI